MSRAAALREHDDTSNTDQIIVFHDVTWEDYEHLLETWCIDRGIEVTPFGSWTLKGQQKDRAAEADECYVFGTEPRDRPHLAIEVEWTRGGIDKLQLCEKLGVDEVWTWRRGVIQVYVLAGERYAKAERSRVLPGLDLALLASMLDRDTLTQAVRDFRKALEAEPRP